MKQEVIDQIRIAYKEIGVDLSDYTDKEIYLNANHLVDHYANAINDTRYRFVPVKRET